MKSAKGKQALAAACFLGGAVVLVFAPAPTVAEEEPRVRRRADAPPHGAADPKALNWHNSQSLPDPAQLIDSYADNGRCFGLLLDAQGAALPQAAWTEPPTTRSTRRRHRRQSAAGTVELAALDGDRAEALLEATSLRAELAAPEASPSGPGTAIADETVGAAGPLACLLGRTEVARLLGGLAAVGRPANAQATVTLTRPARLFASAAGKKVIRALEMGVTLHPTGTTRGFMWEIEDELGNRGWVSSTCCSCPVAEICRTRS